MNILELLQGQLSPEVLAKLGDQIGVQNPDQVAAASHGIISTLLAALGKNASTSGGLAALVSAIDRDHDGSILNDLLGYLTGGNATMTNTNPSTLPDQAPTQIPTSGPASSDGSGILGHVLGGLQPNVLAMLSKVTGLDVSKLSQLAMVLAPIVMGALGQQRQQGTPVGGIGNLLRTVTQGGSAQPVMGLLNKFLDRNGDGSIIDDIARLGMAAFKK